MHKMIGSALLFRMNMP